MRYVAEKKEIRTHFEISVVNCYQRRLFTSRAYLTGCDRALFSYRSMSRYVSTVKRILKVLKAGMVTINSQDNAILSSSSYT